MNVLRGLLAALLLSACATTQPASGPHLRADGSEPPVVATVRSGPEGLPQWDRQPEARTATLPIPADVLFPINSAELGGRAEAILQSVIDEIRSHASRPITVTVEGFADSDGEASFNQALSERRAAAVVRWLVTRGVDPAGITARGWGETRPAVHEIDEATKARNRRVVVTVTY